MDAGSNHVSRKDPRLTPGTELASKPNHVSTVLLYGVPIVSLVIECQERLCLAQISNTLLKDFSYNEIHNRRVALGITCVQCTPVQLEILRRAGAMPVSSRRCGMITRREADRLCKSFLGDNAPPRLPEDFAFTVHHECAWGCRGSFLPARYNSSRAKCIKCQLCGLFFSPNKFIFHSHRTGPAAKYVQPDAANFNSWRRHLKLSGTPPDEVVHAWEDVKAMFNGGTRKRLLATSSTPTPSKLVKHQESSPPPPPVIAFPPPRVPPFPELSRSLVMDYMWHVPWLKRAPLLFPTPTPAATPTPLFHGASAFRPVLPALAAARADEQSDDDVDIETTEEEAPAVVASTEPAWSPHSEPAADSALAGDVGFSDVKPPAERLTQEQGDDRLWAVARLDRAFYRQEMARQLHIMRELSAPVTSEAYFSLSEASAVGARCRARDGHKLALDCSACHQLYTNTSLPSDKMTH